MSSARYTETVISAIPTGTDLNKEAGVCNKEAGVCNKSLTNLLDISSTEEHKNLFNSFCKELMCIIHGCFDHFHRIFPPLAKMRAHRDFSMLSTWWTFCYQ